MANYYIGFDCLGNDYEFSIIKETDKAFLVNYLDFHIWLPKYWFDDQGSIKENYNDTFWEKVESKQ